MKEKIEALESLIYDILNDLDLEEVDERTTQMCHECLMIIEKLKRGGDEKQSG